MTKKILLYVGLFLYTTFLFASTPPKIFNFRIESAEKNRVYFDSDKPITGASIEGFTISNNNVSGVVINDGSTNNHYFKVASSFSFWDNNTIRYEGGSDIIDENNNGLIEFTLSYIINNIPEPSTSKDRFVTHQQKVVVMEYQNRLLGH